MNNEHAPLPNSALPLDRRVLLGAAGLAGIAALASRRAEAGPLTPPAGAVASTAKPLGEVEPRIAVNATNTPGSATVLYRITQPGSYYLTGNVQGVGTQSGISINSGGVTLDLNGFSVIGTGAAGGIYGISNSGANLTGVTIRNGVVRSWANNGVELSSPVIDSPVIEDVHAVDNGGVGFNTPRGARLLRCTADGNAGHGFLVRECSLIEGCVASNNGDVGISTSASCVVRDCTVSNNTGYGISLGNASSAHACSSNGNNRGIVSANGGLIVNCTTTGSIVHGIVAGAGSSVINCTAYSSGASGISALQGCLVHGCTSYLNGAVGITCLPGCVVSDNLCVSNAQGNDGAGIIVQSDCRVTGNHCRTNLNYGIFSFSSGSFFANNTCTGNTVNWHLAAGNFVAPIVACPVSVAIDGDTGGAGLGTTNPHANFTF